MLGSFYFHYCCLRSYQVSCLRVPTRSRCRIAHHGDHWRLRNGGSGCKAAAGSWSVCFVWKMTSTCSSRCTGPTTHASQQAAGRDQLMCGCSWLGAAQKGDGCSRLGAAVKGERSRRGGDAVGRDPQHQRGPHHRHRHRHAHERLARPSIVRPLDTFRDEWGDAYYDLVSHSCVWSPETRRSVKEALTALATPSVLQRQTTQPVPSASSPTHPKATQARSLPQRETYRKQRKPQPQRTSRSRGRSQPAPMRLCKRRPAWQNWPRLSRPSCSRWSSSR